MIKLDLQYFGGRGSSGGNKPEGSKAAEATSGNLKFTRTDTGFSVVNEDGTRETVNLTGKRGRAVPLNDDPATKIHSSKRREANGAGPNGVDYYVDSTYTQVYKTSKGVYEVDFQGYEGYLGKNRLTRGETITAVRKRKGGNK